MKSKWGIGISVFVIAVLAISAFLFINTESFASSEQVVSIHSEKMLRIKEMPEDVESDITFIKERIELELKVEQERLRLEQERIKKEEEKQRIEEEKRQEEERLRLEEEKRKEEQKAIEEAQKRVEEEKKSNQTSNKTETATTNPATTAPKQTSTYSGISSFEREVVKYTNIERVKNGLPELQIDNKLSEVAWYKSKDMQTLDYFDHTSPTYGSPFDMMSQFGVSFTAAGENIAYGYPTPEALVQAWMDSPSHRENILNSIFTHIGVGHVESGHYATQMFMRK